MNFTLKRTIIVLIAFLPLMLIACKDREEIPAPPGYAEKDLQLEERLQNYLSQTYPCEITSVEVTATQVLVRGNAAEEHENLYLGEIPPYMDVVNATGFLTTQPVGKGNFEISMERFTETEGMKYDRLLSKWVLFKKGTESNEIVSAARHPDSIYASRQLSPIKLHSKKGIGGLFYNQFVSDIDDLDISSGTVNVVVDHFFHLQQLSGDVPYEYGGKTYYVNENYLETTLDRILTLAAQKEVAVAAILLFDKAENCPDPSFGQLMQHPDFNGGIYTMPNMTTPESVHTYAALMNYLASRYCRTDNRYGRIAHWIIHNEVDAAIQWTNMGDKPITVLTDTYLKSLRLCYNIARQYDPHTEVLASFTHSWSIPCYPGWHPVKDMLNLLVQYSQKEGDFQWGLAYHSYPQDLLNPRSWDDPRATLSMDTEYVTFRNLEVLNRWVLTSENKFRKKIKRSVWLSEAGINCREYSDEGFKEQAAGFAYAWKKINALEGIDGLQWHNWFDNEGDGAGAMLGLRKFIDSHNGEPKPVWELYRQAGTAAEDEAFSESLEVIGIPDWNSVITPF